MLATMADAHREWHTNSGVPMGLTCPWDACDPGMLEPSELRRLNRIAAINAALMRGEDGDATVQCAHCNQIHLAVRYVAECAGFGVTLPTEPDESDRAERLAEDRAAEAEAGAWGEGLR